MKEVSILLYVKNVWELMKTKQNLRNFFSNHPLIDIVTRWGSTLAMIRGYIKIIAYIDLFWNIIRMGSTSGSSLLVQSRVQLILMSYQTFLIY